jgi:hypothetical protein
LYLIILSSDNERDFSNWIFSVRKFMLNLHVGISNATSIFSCKWIQPWTASNAAHRIGRAITSVTCWLRHSDLCVLGIQYW